jgi:hypothetical protein
MEGESIPFQPKKVLVVARLINLAIIINSILINILKIYISSIVLFVGMCRHRQIYLLLQVGPGSGFPHWSTDQILKIEL